MGGAVSFFSSAGGAAVNAAKSAANSAVSAANSAANAANAAANEAASAANAAVKAANSAASQAANQASSIANSANSYVGKARSLADQARRKAAEAQRVAADAAARESESLANRAKSLANEATILANQAKNAATIALDKAKQAAAHAAAAAREATRQINVVRNVVTNTVNSTVSIANTAVSQANVAISTIDTVANAVGSQVPGVQQAYAQARSAINAANAAADKARKAAESAARAGTKVAADAAARAAREAESAARAAASAVNTAVATAVAVAEQVAGTALGVLGGVLGVDLTGGLTSQQCYDSKSASDAVRASHDLVGTDKLLKGQLDELKAAVVKARGTRNEYLIAQAQTQGNLNQLLEYKKGLQEQWNNSPIKESMNGGGSGDWKPVAGHNYNVGYGPVPPMNGIGCLTPARADAIAKYLTPVSAEIKRVADQIRAERSVYDGLANDVKNIEGSIMSLREQISQTQQAAAVVLNDIKRRNARQLALSSKKLSVDKGLCCMKSSELGAVTSSGDFVFNDPITAEEYCGDYWGRNAVCDKYHEEMCGTSSDDSRCACYNVASGPSDSPAVKAVKADPICHDSRCGTGEAYLRSDLTLDKPCATVQLCNTDVVDPKKTINVMLDDCTPFYEKPFYVFLAFLVVLSMAVFLFSGSSEVVGVKEVGVEEYSEWARGQQEQQQV